MCVARHATYVPPITPNVKYIIAIDGANMLIMSPVAEIAVPTSTTVLHPKIFAKELTIGP